MADHTNKTDHELLQELHAKREALRKFRFEVSGSKIRDVKTGRNTRKEIARILTVLNSRKAA